MWVKLVFFTTALIAAPGRADETLDGVDDAFQALRTGGAPGAVRARRLLAAAAPALDDLDSSVPDAARVLSGDSAAPWRGQAHERALAFLTLAALDARAGGCQLAVASTKAAEHHMSAARLAAGMSASEADAPLPLASLLRLWCRVGDDDDRAAVGADVAGALDGGAGVRLAFRGWAPSLAAGGTYGEHVARVARGGDETVFAIVLPRRGADMAHTCRLTAYHVAEHAAPLGPAAARRRAQRAAAKATLDDEARDRLARAARGPRTARGALGGALLASAALGAAATSATIDPRADTRTAQSMPARVDAEIR